MGTRRRRSVFSTDKRIRLGLWGLGRGMSFCALCDALNIDVVAGCDFNEHMRRRFKESRPEALVTADAEEFLSADLDAVLLATYCTGHGQDAVRCLRAGKHVLSEVTAFHTLAEGVQLVETVEKTGLVYNLAENYPFTAPHMYLARKWKEGLFGDLMYAEGEYVHEVRSLAFTHIDGTAIVPGYALHHWRSWLHFHYYCTHSLGPIMVITGTRPTRVVSLPGEHCLPGYPMPKTQGLGGIAPSLISMDNGAVVRNLMGGTTNDVHVFRYWGTKGSAEATDRLFIRLGGSGSSPKMEVKADWGELTELARTTGHGGGDFWVLYYFARQILDGTPAPFDVYAAADVTIPGILAYRSSTEGGKPYNVPDFRNKKDRDRCRSDHDAQQGIDTASICFPKSADKEIIGRFNTVMSSLLDCATLYRAYSDWMTVVDSVVDPKRVLDLADNVIREHPRMLDVVRKARALADMYPRSEGARLLSEMLEVGGEASVTHKGFLKAVKDARRRLARRVRLVRPI